LTLLKNRVKVKTEKENKDKKQKIIQMEKKLWLTILLLCLTTPIHATMINGRAGVEIIRLERINVPSTTISNAVIQTMQIKNQTYFDHNLISDAIDTINKNLKQNSENLEIAINHNDKNKINVTVNY